MDGWRVSITFFANRTMNGDDGVNRYCNDEFSQELTKMFCKILDMNRTEQAAEQMPGTLLLSMSESMNGVIWPQL